MPVPSYGAPPLAKFFLIVRAFQLICFIAIIGITANFVAEIVSTGADVAREIVGTLVVTSIAALYCLLTIPFFYANANLGLLVMTTLDFLLLIAFVVVAVVLGKPLSYLNCYVVQNTSASVNAASAYVFTESIGNNVNVGGDLVGWSGTTRANCFESKAIWGMSIALW